jgi:hypothetical protein
LEKGRERWGEGDNEKKIVNRPPTIKFFFGQMGAHLTGKCPFLVLNTAEWFLNIKKIPLNGFLNIICSGVGGGGGTEKTLLFGTSLKEYSLINTF